MFVNCSAIGYGKSLCYLPHDGSAGSARNQAVVAKVHGMI